MLVTACGPSYPKCDTDDNCQSGEYCVNGECQLCRGNADCPEGQECAGGRCDAITNYCARDAECGDGRVCNNNNRCIEDRSGEDDNPPMSEEPRAPQSVLTDCSIQNVPFAYDSDTLDGRARDLISQNADCLRRHRAHVHLTGHTDPRGTEEYNLALGDRRARTVKQYLINLGVPSGVITVSSMGEEMATGTDLDSWRDDRRVDFTERPQ